LVYYLTVKLSTFIIIKLILFKIYIRTIIQQFFVENFNLLKSNFKRVINELFVYQDFISEVVPTAKFWGKKIYIYNYSSK